MHGKIKRLNDLAITAIISYVISLVSYIILIIIFVEESNEFKASVYQISADSLTKMFNWLFSQTATIIAFSIWVVSNILQVTTFIIIVVNARNCWKNYYSTVLKISIIMMFFGIFSSVIWIIGAIALYKITRNELKINFSDQKKVKTKNEQ